MSCRFWSGTTVALIDPNPHDLREAEMKLLDNAFGIHERALAVRNRRVEILSQNIANADTPNYKARDIDFKR
jgi:Flagellar basal body protein